MRGKVIERVKRGHDPRAVSRIARLLLRRGACVKRGDHGKRDDHGDGSQRGPLLVQAILTIIINNIYFYY
jgi:hypothetical protein